MKKITLKCLCLALAALLVTPTLAACRQGEDPVDTTASDTSDVATPENTTAPTEEETDPPSPSLPRSLWISSPSPPPLWMVRC